MVSAESEPSAYMESNNTMNRILTLISVVGLAVFASGCTVATYPARPVYYEPAPPPPVYYQPAPPVVVYPAPPRPVIVRPVPPPYRRHCDRFGRCW